VLRQEFTERIAGCLTQHEIRKTLLIPVKATRSPHTIGRGAAWRFQTVA
jgi:hypothetical protein